MTKHTPYIQPLLILLVCSLVSCEPKNDTNEIKQMMQDYRAAWKAGDSAQILQHLSPDIVLFQPGKQRAPIVGKKAVRAFWFPKSEVAYPIINYKIEHKEIGGGKKIAYYQGLSRLTWCTLENGIARDTTLSVSEFTNILRKEEGKWKIYRILYNLKDPKYSR
jgi:ketosteroid isomerase-like protein